MMAGRQIPISPATDAMQPDDLAMFYNDVDGNIVIETRTAAQLQEYLEGGTGTGALPESELFVDELGDVTVAQTTLSTITIDTSQVAPTQTRESQIRLAVDAIGTANIPYAAIQDLTAFDSQALPTGGLADNNSVSANVGTLQIRIGLVNNVSGAANTTDEYFALSLSEIGNYTVTVSYVQLALEPYADRNLPSETVPLSRQERELPDPSTGTANQVPVVSGNSYVLADQTGGGSTAGSARLDPQATIPVTTGIPLGAVISVAGDLYELIPNTEDSNVYHGVIGNLGNSFFGDATFQWESISPFNIRVNFLKTGLTTQPATIYARITVADGFATDLELARAAGADTATTYRYHKGAGGAGIDEALSSVGKEFNVSFYSDGARTTALTIHTANRWAPELRNVPHVLAEALQGNTDRWPKNKLPADVSYGGGGVRPGYHLTDRSPGLDLTRTDADRINIAPYYYSNPTIDLDTYAHGEFHCSLELTIAPDSDVNMGFVRNKANQTAADRNRAASNILFASDLAQETAWADAAGSRDNGLTMFTREVYSLNTLVGTYYILLVKNANNQVGYYYYWDGQSGATGADITAELRITFTPQDQAYQQRTSRGALQATSSILPVSGLTSGNPIAGVSWTIPSGSGMAVSSGNSTQIVEPELKVTPTQIGWWIVSEVDGTEYSETFEPLNQWWRGVLEVSATQAIYFNRQAVRRQFRLDANSRTLPANTRVKFYLAVI